MTNPSHSSEPTRVLVWSPRPELVQRLKSSLPEAGLRAFRASGSVTASLQEVRPGAVVIDAVVSRRKALKVCLDIQQHQGGKAGTPILLIAAPADTDAVRRAFNLGVSDFAEEPVSGELLAIRIQTMVRVASEQLRLRDEVAHAQSRADRDGLTGLASRQSFMHSVNDALPRARRGGYPAALLYIDLDRFKSINDTLGHAAGDAILQQVAGLLRGHVRPTDVVGSPGAQGTAAVSRLGGDEFTVLLSKVRRPEDAGDVVRRILEAMKMPVSVSGHEISTSASVGIAVFPQDGEDAETLLKRADLAMYEAKARGPGTYRFYQPSMGQTLLRRLDLEGHLRHALERDELEVRYQPRVDLHSETVVGGEALLRWNSRELGWVQPKEFIPVAEETGLIVSIGAWVLETACAQLARWRRHGWPGLRISVNVSSQQFASSDVTKTAAEALRAHGLAPDTLELEVTESLMLGENDRTALALRDLRAIGVTLALDDFGTGYSSLSFLTRFPLDVLKIDRSIASQVTADPASASIVEAVVAMGRRLELRIVAEGVDALEQALQLRQLGCDEIQGFLISEAVTAEEWDEFCRGWRGLEPETSS